MRNAVGVGMLAFVFTSAAKVNRLESADLRWRSPHVMLGYGVAALSVVVATIAVLWMRRELGQQSTPIVAIFLCAVMFSAWFGGAGPGLLAIGLAALALDYFFMMPFYSLAVEVKEIPRLLVFVTSALFVGVLSSMQGSKAESLRHARDILDGTVEELKRTNEALQAENAERKRAEERLQTSESRLAEAQQLAHIGSWNLDLRSSAIEWSDEHYRIFGLKPQDPPVTRERAWKYLHPDDRESVQNLLAGAVRDRHPFETRFRVIRDDGTTRILHSRGGPPALLDEGGTPTRIYGTVQDITERAQAEAALADAKRKIDAALIAGEVGTWEWDVKTGRVWGDQNFARFYNVETDASGAAPHTEYIQAIHPDDRERVRTAIKRTLETGSNYRNEYRVKGKDGLERWLILRANAERDAAGQVIRFPGIVLDITQRKRAEEALSRSEERVRLLLESTAEAIYGLDVAGNCTFCNPACLRLLGYRDPGELLGKPMHALIHHSRRNGTVNPMEADETLRAFLQGKEVHTEDEVLWRADGSSFPAEYWSYPMRRDGQVVGAVVTFLDITERKRLEKGILEISEQERRRIGQDLHDDLCQQLTGIAFTGQLLQQRLAARSIPDADVAEQIVKAVQQATARARDLAKGLHPVRLESDGLVAALRELTANVESVFQISCRFRCRAVARNVRVADPVVAIQLYRMAQEAATNAVKHGKAKTVCISIGLLKGQLKLAVADDGVGMVGTPQQEGMGLPVMHQRARMIGASLTISRRRKGGTLVTCSLDAALAAGGVASGGVPPADERDADE